MSVQGGCVICLHTVDAVMFLLKFKSLIVYAVNIFFRAHMRSKIRDSELNGTTKMPEKSWFTQCYRWQLGALTQGQVGHPVAQ